MISPIIFNDLNYWMTVNMSMHEMHVIDELSDRFDVVVRRLNINRNELR